MDDNLMVIIMVLGILLIIIGGIIIHENIETDFDKCLDECGMFPNDERSNEIQKECILGCSILSKCVEK